MKKAEVLSYTDYKFVSVSRVLTFRILIEYCLQCNLLKK